MRQGLLDLIKWTGLPRSASMVEVGCYRGESTEIWAQHFDTISAVDPWIFPDAVGVTVFDIIKAMSSGTLGAKMKNDVAESLAVFGKVLPSEERRTDIDWEHIATINEDVEASFDQRMAPYNITKLKMTSLEASRRFDDKSLDMIYIDANHDYDSAHEDIRIWKPKVRPGGVLSGHNYHEQWPDVIKAVQDIVGTPDMTFQDTSWSVRIDT